MITSRVIIYPIKEINEILYGHHLVKCVPTHHGIAELHQLLQIQSLGEYQPGGCA